MKNRKLKIMAVGALSLGFAATSISQAQVVTNDTSGDEPPRALSVVLESYNILNNALLAPEMIRRWPTQIIARTVRGCENVDFEASRIENATINYHLSENLSECILSGMAQAPLRFLDKLVGEGIGWEESIHLLKPFTNRPELAQTLVDYALPLIRTTAASLSTESLSALRETLVRLQTYAQNLQGAELVAERNYENGPVEAYFAFCSRQALRSVGGHRCRGHASSQGREAEAFIYRRISEGLPRAFVISTLQSLIDVIVAVESSRS